MEQGKMREIADKLARDLVDQGRLIEAGWQVYRLLCLKVPPHEPRNDLHEAFNAGAEHVFASIVQMLDPGDEPTAADLRRMDNIHAELEPIRAALKLKYGRTAGSA